ncbi:MAG: hypothetical protein P8018_06540 [Acidobacteriota bacterium]
MRLRVPKILELPPLEGPSWREYTLLALTLLIVFLACYQPLWDPDSFWHLAVGREIWQTHHLVRTETFSFSALGHPWEDTEWLFHVVAYPLWKLGGDTLLCILTTLLGVLAVGILYRCVRLLGGSAVDFAAYMLVMLFFYQVRVRFRPEVASLVLMAILVEALLRWKPPPDRLGRFWIFSSIFFCFWAQVHGGWSYGLLLLGAVLAGHVLDALRERRLSARYLGYMALNGLAPAAAVFINPYGWRIPWFPVKSLIGFLNPHLIQIEEWTHTPWHGIFLLFDAVCILLLIYLLVRYKRLTWVQWLWATSQVFLGLYWVRYTAFLVLTLVPAGVAAIRDASRVLRARRLVWGVILFGVLVRCSYQYVNFTPDFNLTYKYPVQEANFLKTHHIKGNLFNTYTVGGYLDWELYPLDRIFMDGRYYPFEKELVNYHKAYTSIPAYHKFLKKYPFDIVLYPYNNFYLKEKAAGGRKVSRGASVVLFPPKSWSLVYFGNYGMVLLKREPRYQKIIKKFGYNAMRPDDLKYLVKEASAGRISSERLVEVIEAKLKKDPYIRIRGQLTKALDQLKETHDKPE